MIDHIIAAATNDNFVAALIVGLAAIALLLASSVVPAGAAPTAPCAECLEPVPVGTTYCSTRCRNAGDRHDEGDL